MDCIILYGNSTLPLSKYAGTFRIATELRKYGYTVQTIDVTAFNGFDEDLENILDKLISNKTKWIGFSTTFLHNIFGFPYFRSQLSFEKRFSHIKDLDKNIKRFVNFVKLKNKNIKIICGGSRRFMLEQFGFKVFTFYNDKEIIEFTDYCSGKNKNLKYRSNLIQGSEFQEFATSKIEFLESDIIQNLETLPIEISRGCIFKCKFCAFPMNGKSKGDWVKHSNILIDEFTYNYEKFGVTNYIFSDDTYNDDPNKVKLLYDTVYSKLPFKINFTSYIRLDLLIRYPDTVDYIVNSGLISALFGIETINHNSGKAIGKGVDPELQFEFLRNLKKDKFKNVSIYSGFILGLPKDRHNEIELLEEFLMSEKNPLDSFSVEPLFINPKDAIYSNKLHYSDFDLEYQKYGYKCYEQIENSAFNEIRWTNPNLSFNFDDAFKFSRKINNVVENSKKFKYSGFYLSYLYSLGISKKDLLTLSIFDINQKYNINELLKILKENYKKDLKKFL